MRIYVAHSKKMNYIDELYKPLRNDDFFANLTKIKLESNIGSSLFKENIFLY